jgi:DNA-binding PadR family transcriptional regulator
MNARLLILGVLHRGDFHPYEIRRRLEAAMVECYIDVDVGTLYYAVRQLEKDGFIEPVAREQVPRGGIRTIYRITSEGKAEFLSGLHQQFVVDGPVSKTLYGALLFLHLADPGRVKECLEHRLQQLDDRIAKLDRIKGDLKSVTSTGGDHLLRHIEAQRRLDRAWIQGLLETIEADGIQDVPDARKLERR